MSRKTKKEGTLNFFLTSASLNPIITKADIFSGYKTDHSLITIHLTNNNNPRGAGFWKLNTSFLLDSKYINLIKKTIAEVTRDYKYNKEVDAVLLWDTMKMQIRSNSLKYAKEKRAKLKSKEKSSESDISCLQKKLVYVLSSLATPRGVMNEVNSLLYNFLWDGKSDKIKRTEMINDYNKGGLIMIDFQSFNQSFKMK